MKVMNVAGMAHEGGRTRARTYALGRRRTLFEKQNRKRVSARLSMDVTGQMCLNCSVLSAFVLVPNICGTYRLMRGMDDGIARLGPADD